MQGGYFGTLREMLSHRVTWFKLVKSSLNSSVSREMVISSNGMWFCETSPIINKFHNNALSAAIEWGTVENVIWEGSYKDFEYMYGGSRKHQGILSKMKSIDGKEWPGLSDSLKKSAMEAA
jgi:hypothetical protein